MSKCTRCGKVRIVASSYEEELGNSTLAYTITVCPDPVCQKIVENSLKEEELRRITMSEEHKKRTLQREASKLRLHYNKN